MILTINCDDNDVDNALVEVRDSYTRGHTSGTTSAGGTWEVIDDAVNDSAVLGQIFH